MAPKKPKKPTMLQRQRALRKMTQERKARSSKQLPPKGQTSANSRQARSQRTTTAKAQAANQQRVIARGMEGFVRRGKAMDKLDKAAKGTKGSGTRTAGAGGGLTRVSKPISRARRLPPSSQGGRRVGNSSQPFGEQPVRKVKVRDLGSTKTLKGGKTTPKQLPPAQQGPQAATRRQRAQAKADAAAKGTRGPNRVGQPAGAANRKYGANVVNNAVKRAQRTTRVAKGAGLIGKALTPLAIAAQIGDVMRVGRQNKRWDAYKKRMGMNQKPISTNRRGQGSGNKPRSTDMKPKADWRDKVSSSNVDKLRQGQNDTIRSYAGKTPAAKPKPQPKAPARTSERASAPARTSSPAPSRPSTPAAPKERRVSAATANRESGNYGTSRTNNPMIDDAMKARMRRREERAGVGPVKDGNRYAADVKNNTKGVGPVKNGNRYAGNLKSSPSTPGKKKEDETKKMSLAERIRRRRAGLA